MEIASFVVHWNYEEELLDALATIERGLEPLHAIQIAVNGYVDPHYSFSVILLLSTGFERIGKLLLLFFGLCDAKSLKQYSHHIDKIILRLIESRYNSELMDMPPLIQSDLRFLTHDPLARGLIKLLNDFQQTQHRYRYLNTITDKVGACNQWEEELSRLRVIAQPDFDLQLLFSIEGTTLFKRTGAKLIIDCVYHLISVLARLLSYSKFEPSEIQSLTVLVNYASKNLKV